MRPEVGAGAVKENHSDSPISNSSNNRSMNIPAGTSDGSTSNADSRALNHSSDDLPPAPRTNLSPIPPCREVSLPPTPSASTITLAAATRPSHRTALGSEKERSDKGGREGPSQPPGLGITYQLLLQGMISFLFYACVSSVLCHTCVVSFRRRLPE
jgi:hypothetical protein